MGQQSSMHEMITKQMLEYMALGIYLPEEKLPSVRELSAHFHVNPNTVSKVYNELESEGYIFAIPAKGYYVAKKEQQNKEDLLSKIKSLLHEVMIYAKLGDISCDDIVTLLNKAFEKGELTYD